MPADRNQPASPGEDRTFRHQAILYTGTDDFVAQTSPLVEAALDADTPVLVALTPTTLGGLRESLGRDAERVRWIDITGIGLNPARIIPVWRGFVAHHRRDGQTRPVFGIGQPIYAGRTPAETVEAERHEALLNLAFRETPNFDLYCPYDVETLGPEVVDAAGRTHPHVQATDARQLSTTYRPEVLAGAFTAPLSMGEGPAWQISLDHRSMAEVHRLIVDRGCRLVSDATRGRGLGDVALAAVAVSAGIGGQRLRMWSEQGQVLVEIEGRVPIVDPLAGREWPAPTGEPEHGLWLANQLCDLVQWRSDGRSSVVRLRQG
ncbi:MAG: sensor histidine kinase [Candidatus Dormibacteraeota bacterium]|nr:sensor histidine kinase [Candidatus Dormibacteraeota bacterium]